MPVSYNIKKDSSIHSSSIRIAISGASGKMGQALLSIAEKDPNLKAIYPLTRNLSKQEFEKTLKEVDVALDFSSEIGTEKLISIAVKVKKPLVIGTTGLSEHCFQKMQKAARTIPLLYSPNFSLGIALVTKMLDSLKKNSHLISSVKIVDIHHAQKKDSPSGTAIKLARFFKQNPQIESIRQGEEIGTHQILLDFPNEQISLEHKVCSREVFAQGALHAARFLQVQAPGFYTLEDCLN